MNRSRIIAMTVATASLLCALEALAQGIQGVWARPNGNAKMRIEPCGDALCGVLVWLREPASDVNNPDPSLRDRSLLGSKVLYDLKPAGRSGKWKGRLYNAENGKTYRGSVTLEGDEIDMMGCVVIFCDAEKWTRSTL